MLLQLIGERIRQFRKAKGLTQEELAEKAGVNASYMGTVERGDRNISIETLEKIMQGLDVSPTDFFQFHAIENDDLKNENDKLLEMLKSLLYSRPPEENRLIYRIVTDIIKTLDEGKNR